MIKIGNPKGMFERLSSGRATAFRSFGFRVLDLFRISSFGFCASLLLLMLVVGCRTGGERLKTCSGKASVEEALKTLAANASTAVPMRAKGEAMLTYHEPDKRVARRDNLLLEVRYDPPHQMYVAGSVSVKPRVVVLGSNGEQFWLALSIEEISDYYLGDWSEARGAEGRMMGVSPQVVLEAFGILGDPNAWADSGSWTLSNKGPYDILTQQDETGRAFKRAFVYACDYRVYKIEYLDYRGKVVATAQLGLYEPVTEGFYVPTQIRIVSTAQDGRKDSMEIKLSGLKPYEFNDRQRLGLFKPPDADKYRNVYHYEAGEWVPQ
jgi:hypothetical protein